MEPQPTDSTCGPTCLQAVYAYFGDRLELHDIAADVRTMFDGGTLAVFLGNHALRRGYRATIYSYNVQVFDPTWFRDGSAVDIAAKLREQMRWKNDLRLHAATLGYLDFLELGGTLRHGDLTSRLISRLLGRGLPIITGLSSTYLYRTVREYGPDCVDDDVRGTPSGHFVVLAGYDAQRRMVSVADPYGDNPIAKDMRYDIPMARLIGAVFLGILTHDANLLVLEKPEPS